MPCVNRVLNFGGQKAKDASLQGLARSVRVRRWGYVRTAGSKPEVATRATTILRPPHFLGIMENGSHAFSLFFKLKEQDDLNGQWAGKYEPHKVREGAGCGCEGKKWLGCGLKTVTLVQCGIVLSLSIQQTSVRPHTLLQEKKYILASPNVPLDNSILCYQKVRCAA